MRAYTLKGAAKASLNNSTAKMYRIHRAIMATSFEAVNTFKRQGDLIMAEQFRQACLDNFYKMKSYEMILVKEMR